MGEHYSTAAQRSPTGVLLTGCPHLSVPITPGPLHPPAMDRQTDALMFTGGIQDILIHIGHTWV